MATINIPSYHDDPNYRYKMPKLRAKVEGRGNGIRTNIMNMGDISKSLKRPPEYTTKFFGCELGTQSKYDLTQGSAIVNGQHDERDLQMLVDKFIEKFVLCTNCQLPEMDLLISDGVVGGKCNACGHACDLDNVHKLATFIVKNPKEGVESTMGGKTGGAGPVTAAAKKRTKEDRQREKAERSRRKAAGEDMDEEDKKAERKAEKKAERKAEKKAEKKAKKKLEKQNAESGGEEEEGGSESGKGNDSAKGEKEKKKKSKKNGTVALIQNESLSLDSPELADVISRMKTLMLSDPKPSEVFQELRALQISQHFDSAARLFCSLDSLFHETISPELLEKKLPFIQEVCDSSITPAQICSVLEEFLYRRHPNSWNLFPLLLQRLYNGELLDEDEILDYYAPADRESKAAQRRLIEPQTDAYVAARTAGGPFFVWLQEEEEESDGDEE